MIMESPWNAEQNKAFERALALFDEDSGMERWENIANYVPCKSAAEIKRHYEVLMEDIEAIESGLVSPPHYSEASYVPNWLTQQQQQQPSEPTNANSVPCVQPCSKPPCQPSFSVKPTPAPSKAFEQERKKGVPWTEEEHRMFLLGLNKYGKGDWRSISRNFVVSRTPTQVASHAQKYFLRLSSANKEKKRSSIHDITSVGVTEIKQQSPSQQQPQQQPPLAPTKSLSTTSTAPIQSLGYPASSLGVSMSNAMGSHLTGSNHMMLPPHTLGLYPTPGNGFENSSRNVSQRASFSLPQMELSAEHDAYYVGNLMSID